GSANPPPVPPADEEPIATIVTGSPNVSFFAKCGSGLASRIRSSGAPQAGAISARAGTAAASPARSAAAATDFVTRRLGRSSRNGESSLLSTAAVDRRLFWFGRRDHEICQQPTYAIMDPLGDVKFFRS